MSVIFREQLRNELDYQGVLVKELSNKTGIPIATLDCYLGTRATIPSAETAVKIARALNVSVEYLVTGDKSANEGSVTTKPNPKAQEIIRLIEGLDSKQCDAIINLLKSFNVNVI